jgi:hypothetical protein
MRLRGVLRGWRHAEFRHRANHFATAELFGSMSLEDVDVHLRSVGIDPDQPLPSKLGALVEGRETLEHPKMIHPLGTLRPAKILSYRSPRPVFLWRIFCLRPVAVLCNLIFGNPRLTCERRSIPVVRTRPLRITRQGRAGGGWMVVTAGVLLAAIAFSTCVSQVFRFARTSGTQQQHLGQPDDGASLATLLQSDTFDSAENQTRQPVQSNVPARAPRKHLAQGTRFAVRRATPSPEPSDGQRTNLASGEYLRSGASDFLPGDSQASGVLPARRNVEGPRASHNSAGWGHREILKLLGSGGMGLRAIRRVVFPTGTDNAAPTGTDNVPPRGNETNLRMLFAATSGTADVEASRFPVFTRRVDPLRLPAFTRRADSLLAYAAPQTSIVRASLGDNDSQTPGPDWVLDPQQSGQVSVASQPTEQILATVRYDPVILHEEGQNGVELLANFLPPPMDGDDVYVESKDEANSISAHNSEKWHENKFTWQNGSLVKIWTFDTDWVALDSANDFWTLPVYHAALANGFVYDMGAGGTLFKLNKSNGSVVKRLNPFENTIDPNTFTASPPSVDANGNIYYNVVKIAANTQEFYSGDVVGSWLVKVTPNDTITKVAYTTLLSQGTIKGEPVPAGKGQCDVSSSASQLPWPPGSDAVASTTTCGTQRAGLNVAPVIAPDGTIYTVSKAHSVTRCRYLIAVNQNLTGRWAASLRDHMHDDCNESILPVNGQPGGCRVGSTKGADPEVKHPGMGRVLDDESSTPTVAPDGTILLATYRRRYNHPEGHLLQFSANGDFISLFGFGCDKHAWNPRSREQQGAGGSDLGRRP